jgi:hypothetical protein
MEEEGTLTFVAGDFCQPMRRVCDLWGVHEDQSKVSEVGALGAKIPLRDAAHELCSTVPFCMRTLHECRRDSPSHAKSARSPEPRRPQHPAER